MGLVKLAAPIPKLYSFLYVRDTVGQEIRQAKRLLNYEAIGLVMALITYPGGAGNDQCHSLYNNVMSILYPR